MSWLKRVWYPKKAKSKDLFNVKLFTTFDNRMYTSEAFELLGHTSLTLSSRQGNMNELTLMGVNFVDEGNINKLQELGLIIIDCLREDDLIADYGPNGFKVLFRCLKSIDNINIPIDRIKNNIQNLPAIEFTISKINESGSSFKDAITNPVHSKLENH